MTSQILNSFQFSLLQQILAMEGLDLPGSAREVFELRIQRFALRQGLHLDQLPFLLKQDETLRLALLESLIIHESYFYREPHHFNAMTRHILPNRVNCHDRPITILSAGCASGEEAYSIRIFILENFPGLSNQIEITGMDRSMNMVNAAQNPHYSAHSLREMPVSLIEKYFTQEPSGLFFPNPDVRENVRFSHCDLLKKNLGKSAYDIIFCRNVMMYLTTEAKERLILNFEAALKPGGALFIGTTEVFSDPPKPFRKCHFENSFFYEKTGECP
ncbi:MAG: hypothetical protein DRJ08_02630 [Acidobacteria bacterium]|nr:MAG: hypothetical protein DRJ14_00690 [Acidobacteriota bacterium]RLE23398.1 MAG: hypothetical protein DRJ08_02630 [Acidobacteriota bacterium]